MQMTPHDGEGAPHATHATLSVGDLDPANAVDQSRATATATQAARAGVDMAVPGRRHYDNADDATCDVSVVFPVYNEEGNLEPLYEETRAVLDNMALSYELVFVDDGSSDQSVSILRRLAGADSRVRVVVFRRNFGQTAAMAAGLDYAHGEVIITMDADRQNNPVDIPRLLSMLYFGVDDKPPHGALPERASIEPGQGYDLVCGWRYDRKDGFLLRRLPSITANRIISATTDVKLHDYGCTLKAFRRQVAKNINLYGEMHRFIPAIASWMGVSIAELRVNHRPRISGVSKYGISRTLRVVLDLITVKYLLSYSSRPLQLFGAIGMYCGLVGFLIGLVMTVQRLAFNVPLSDRPLLLLAILLVFIGLQFITIGLLAEVQTRTYHESARKTTYVVREIVNDHPPTEQHPHGEPSSSPQRAAPA